MKALAAIALLFVASASAQAPMELKLDEPILGPIQPDVEAADVTLTATIPCANLVQQTAGFTQTASMGVSFTSPDATTLTGPTRKVVDASPCITDPTGTVQASIPYQAMVTRQAPARTPLTFPLDVVVDGLAGAEELTASITLAILADHWFSLQVEVPEKIRLTNGGPLSYDMIIENFGNGPALIETSLTDAAAGSESWFEGLEPFTIDSGERKTIALDFDIPTALNRQNAFQFTFVPTADGLEGDPEVVNVLVRTQALSREAPGPAFLPIGLAVLGLVAARRHERG